MKKKPANNAGAPAPGSQNSLRDGPRCHFLYWIGSFLFLDGPVPFPGSLVPARGVRDAVIAIQPESGSLARRWRATDLANGIAARSRKANSYNQLDRVIECKKRKESTYVN